ncbi:MAG: hypothetical protein JW995_04665 [Melioribacteraceae bacterium]|nr:hypothetical protein [Melioribacteraceae bacterium]
MNERNIYLLERYLDESASPEEKNEFENLLSANSEFRSEYEEQKRTKEVLRAMKLKNPSVEIWDGYWINVYNRVERGIAWIAISLGFFVCFAYLAILAAENLFENNEVPLLVKAGITILVFGIMLLVYSVVREKLFTYKYDKYKEIQR